MDFHCSYISAGQIQMDMLSYIGGRFNLNGPNSNGFFCAACDRIINYREAILSSRTL